jgi:hypothetical protein
MRITQQQRRAVRELPKRRRRSVPQNGAHAPAVGSASEANPSSAERKELVQRVKSYLDVGSG